MDLFSGVLPFLHTAEERSFRKAAAHLGVTTAAVSKAVARLEAELGGTLRAGRLVEVLAPYAAEGPPIRALCLPRRQSTPRVRVFLDFLQQLLRRER